MSWPNAGDPFYLGNPGDNDARRGYYGVNGTPTWKCDGANCGTSQASAIAAINARLAIPSPIWMDEIISVMGTTMTVTVKAVATQNFTAGYSLLIVLMDRYDYLPNSPNGQPNHYHPMRDIAPTGTGQNFTATANDTVTYTGSFTLSPSWDITNLDVACFVQYNGTKEIIQGHLEQAPVNISNVYYVSHTLDDNNNHDGRAEPGETAFLRVTLGNPAPYQPATNVVATLSTTDPTLTITTPTVNFPNIPNGGQGTNTTNPFVFAVSASAVPHYSSLHLHVVANPLQTVYDTDIPLTIGWPGIVLVDDDGGLNYDTWYQGDLDSLGLVNDVWHVQTQGSIPLVELQRYPRAVWHTSNTTNPLTADEQTTIQTYLSGGGHLFLTGENIDEQFVGQPFYTNVLHAASAGQAGSYQLTGVTGDPISNGTTLLLAGSGGAGNCQSPATITPQGTASTVYTYNINSLAGGLRWESGTNKLVYFAFCFEAASGMVSTNRRVVFQNIMNWLQPSAPPQNMEVNITPVSPPIVIPANGGSFPYNLNVHNLTTQSQTFAVWNKFRTPSGSYIAAIGPLTRTLPGGVNPTRVLNQNVAATIPSGTIYYISYIGTYPSTIQDSSFFTFTKSAMADGGPWISESNCTGDFLEEYAVATVPADFAMVGVYPNPFNPTTTLSFTLANAGTVQMSIYDVNGREVANLINGYREAGSHSVTFDASHLTSGVYVYRLTSGDQVASGKMVLLK
jgi:hypothetical protein